MGCTFFLSNDKDPLSRIPVCLSHNLYVIVRLPSRGRLMAPLVLIPSSTDARLMCASVAVVVMQSLSSRTPNR